ncbi:MAG: DUF3089 domain-containing protein, partial [Acidobacteriota bacterium]|nr:DUF3089 domain-containing protein [Acidobacteriota bacterium]
TTWLCNPWSINDPCRNNETASVETASGATSIEWAHPQFDPPIDCFYVYPTVSQQIAANANDEVEPQETAIATDQASRFSQKCRVYAPMYPQVTLFALALEAIGFGEVSQSVVSTAYRGVLAAWDEYLADYNDGRGVVLIGHSQGAAMLIRLIKSEIDGSPAERGLLVAAYLMGGQVTVPIGKSVGGDFRSVPSCRSAAQTGCVVAYSSYLRTPPSGSGFGRVGPNNLAGEPSAPANAGELQILCVNPAQLVSGAAGIHPYFPTERFPGLLGLAEGAVPSALTPWVTYPAKYTASCRYEDDTSWLQVDDVGPPNDVRPSVEEAQGPAIGLHLADLNIESGDLVSLMGMQRESYLSGR